MSADNWSKCPNCSEIKQNKIDKLDKKITNSYGKIDEEKYVALQKTLTVLLIYQVEETLREDYEIGMNDGVFYAIYDCSCSKCGWNWHEKIEKQAL